MKVTRRSKRSGSAMILALFAFLFMAGIGGAIFSLTLAGARTTRTASMGDGSYHVAEAGIDDAINKMRAYLKAPSNKDADYFDVFTNPTKDANGDPVNVITGSIRGGTYTVTISPFLETGVVQNYTISSVGKLAGQKRGIRTIVSAEEKPGAFKYGLFGDKGVTVQGNVYTDGYKSTQVDGSLWAYTDQAKNPAPDGKTFLANPTGSVGSNGLINDNGNSFYVYGTGTPGPGYKIDDEAAKSFYKTTTTDTQLELKFEELNTADPTTSIVYEKKGATTLNAAADKLYKVTDLNKELIVNTNGLDVKIYVSGDIKLTGSDNLTINGGGTVTIYQDSSSGKNAFSIAGNALINNSSTPSAAKFYTNTKDATINGASNFSGVVYAPSTDISLLGTSSIFGAVVGKTIKAGGTLNFHYDEKLAEIPTGIIEINVKSVDQFVPSSQD